MKAYRIYNKDFTDFWREGRHYRLKKQRAFLQNNVQAVWSDVVLAPLPGKIQKINVKAGESIKQGVIIMTMEAMKMEYKFEAPGDGIILDIYVAEGAQVTMDQDLFKMKVGS